MGIEKRRAGASWGLRQSGWDYCKVHAILEKTNAYSIRTSRPLLGRLIQPVHHLLHHQPVLAGRQGFRAVGYINVRSTIRVPFMERTSL